MFLPALQFQMEKYNLENRRIKMLAWWTERSEHRCAVCHFGNIGDYVSRWPQIKSDYMMLYWYDARL